MPPVNKYNLVTGGFNRVTLLLLHGLPYAKFITLSIIYMPL